MITKTEKYSGSLFSDSKSSNSPQSARYKYNTDWVLDNRTLSGAKKSTLKPKTGVFFSNVVESVEFGNIFKAINTISNLESFLHPIEDNFEYEKVLNVNNERFLLPFQLDEIFQEIKSSEYILSLEEDWDQQGSLSISPEIYSASLRFLVQYSKFLFKKGIIIRAPEINPCPDGTIDLSWRTNNARMLINFRNSSKGILAYYYGDLYQNEAPIKGHVSAERFSEYLAVWMKKLK